MASKSKKAASKEVTISWEAFAKALGIDYDGIDEFQASDQAAQEASQWVEEYEKEANRYLDEGEAPFELTPDESDEVRFAIQEAIEDHWALQKVLERNLDLDEVFGAINEWGERGQQAAIYEEEMPQGQAVNWHGADSDGLSITIFEPFRTAYAEAAYCVHGFGHEGQQLSEFDAADVARVAKWISECQGSPNFELDLERWDDKRNGPKYEALAKLVERKPAAKSKSKSKAKKSK